MPIFYHLLDTNCRLALEGVLFPPKICVPLIWSKIRIFMAVTEKTHISAQTIS
jgi:hypothetical protein